MKRYSLDDADKWIGDVAKGMKTSAKRGLVSAAHRTVEYIQAEVIPSTSPMPVDRATYRAAWRAEEIEGGAVVYNSAPHAAVIEHGAKAENVHPGRKMIDALTEWVRRKGIGGHTATSRSGTTRVVKATQTEATRIAWAIAKSMQQHGIFKGKGLGIFAKAQKKIPEFITDEVAAEIKKEFGG